MIQNTKYKIPYTKCLRFWIFAAVLAAGFFITSTTLANCSPSAGGDHTVTSNCSFSGSVNGIDGGNLTINSGVTLTVNANQTIVFNEGKQVNVNGTIAMSANGAQIKKTNLWIKDTDNDGYALNSTDLLEGDAQPANYQRRSTRIGLSDCNDSSATVWQNLTGYLDNDLDTYTTGSGQQICSGASLPSGWRAAVNGGDCNDGNNTVWQYLTGYLDNDGDGVNTSSPTSICSGASLPPARVSAGGDCNDGNASVWQTFYGYRDNDGDGVVGSDYVSTCGGSSNPLYGSPGSDCNDYNPSYSYYNTVYYDGDQDGYGSWSTSLCANGGAYYPYTVNPNDCDDSNGSIYPGTTQYQGCTVYNECSNPCSGSQSNTCQSNGTYTSWSACGGCTPAACCTNTTYYRDVDGDGYGNPGNSTVFCVPGADTTGWVTNNNDCDDSSSGIVLGSQRTRYQTSSVACGTACANETQTCQAGGTWSGSYTGTSCTASTRIKQRFATVCVGSCQSETQTCQTNGSWSPNNYTNDTCSVFSPNTFYQDADGDGYGNASVPKYSCVGADDCVGNPYNSSACVDTGYVSNNTDCNDSNSSINPGRSEVCNGVDDNCNGSVDEGLLVSYYRDADGDGYGSAPVQGSTCGSIPGGYVTNNTDCNDANVEVNPGAWEHDVERSDGGWDWNCDGQITKQWSQTSASMCSDQPLYRNPMWGFPNCWSAGGWTACASPYIGDRSAIACGETIWWAASVGNDFWTNSSCTGTVYRYAGIDIQSCR